MKKSLLLFAVIFTSFIVQAQFVAKMEAKTPIPGTCDTKNIYALCSAFGKSQVEPICPMNNDTLIARIESIKHLKDNPKFKGKMMINCIVNCKGEMVQCEVDNKSGVDDLDAQVLAIFKLLTKWKPGTLNGTTVDCSVLRSIEFKKGKISLL